MRETRASDVSGVSGMSSVCGVRVWCVRRGCELLDVCLACDCNGVRRELLVSTTSNVNVKKTSRGRLRVVAQVRASTQHMTSYVRSFVVTVVKQLSFKSLFLHRQH